MFRDNVSLPEHRFMGIIVWFNPAPCRRLYAAGNNTNVPFLERFIPVHVSVRIRCHRIVHQRFRSNTGFLLFALRFGGLSGFIGLCRHSWPIGRNAAWWRSLYRDHTVCLCARSGRRCGLKADFTMTNNNVEQMMFCKKVFFCTKTKGK